MANPIKGEVLVQVAAGEFTLAYTLGALSALEGRFDGRPFQDVLKELSGDSVPVDTVIAVVWAGLKKHHHLSLDEAADLVSLVELPIWSAKIGQAFALSQPEAKGRKRPRVAAAE